MVYFDADLGRRRTSLDVDQNAREAPASPPRPSRRTFLSCAPHAPLSRSFSSHGTKCVLTGAARRGYTGCGSHYGNQRDHHELFSFQEGARASRLGRHLNAGAQRCGDENKAE